jgi:hypothetical protein
MKREFLSFVFIIHLKIERNKLRNQHIFTPPLQGLTKGQTESKLVSFQKNFLPCPS